MCALHPTIGKCNHCPSLRRDISNLFRLSEGDYERFGCKFIISGNAERSVGTEKDRGNGWTIGLQFISNKSSGEIGWVSEHVLLGRGGWTRPWTAPPKTCRASHTPLHSALRGSGSKSLEWGGKLAFSPSLVFCALLSPSEEKSTVNYFKRNRGRIAHPVELSGSFKCADLKKKIFFFSFFLETPKGACLCAVAMFCCDWILSSAWSLNFSSAGFWEQHCLAQGHQVSILAAWRLQAQVALGPLAGSCPVPTPRLGQGPLRWPVRGFALANWLCVSVAKPVDLVSCPSQDC